VRSAYLELFQSTPPRRGRRSSFIPSIRRQVCFNPRPRAGGDTGFYYKERAIYIVSIHAPAQGATSTRRAVHRSMGFNPRPRAGGDAHVLFGSFEIRPFQSTPPRRGRLTLYYHKAKWYCFNPRPRAGGDPDAEITLPVLNQFQSTPPRRGRRLLRVRPLDVLLVSIHAPAQGAT